MERSYDRTYQEEIEFYTVDIIFIFQKRSPSHFVTTYRRVRAINHS